MKFILVSLLAIVSLSIVGCGSSVDINFDFDQQADFTRYKTFLWMTPDTQMSSLIGQRVSKAVTAQLESKGLQSVSDDPDLLVTYHAGTEAKVDVESYGYGYGGYGGYGRYGGGYGGGGIETYHYTEGTLIIDIIDASRKELVWRGTATGVLSDNPSPEEVDENVRNVVAKILANYPPK